MMSTCIKQKPRGAVWKKVLVSTLQFHDPIWRSHIFSIRWVGEKPPPGKVSCSWDQSVGQNCGQKHIPNLPSTICCENTWNQKKQRWLLMLTPFLVTRWYYWTKKTSRCPSIGPRMLGETSTSWDTSVVQFLNATVDGSGIPNNHLGCIEPSKNWDKVPKLVNRISSINWIIASKRSAPF